jgi:hypothetical protein
MQDIRRPQTPLFWVFHLLSAKEEIEYVRKVCCLYAQVERFVVLQIRDDHHREKNVSPLPKRKKIAMEAIYFLRKEQPSVSLALPPVGWQRTVEQPAQTTTVWACE